MICNYLYKLTDNHHLSFSNIINEAIMNKVYKVIWNHALNCFTVVSETAKSKGKTKSQKSAGGVISSSSCKLNSLTRAMLLMGGLVASNIALASSEVIGTDNQVSGVDPSKVQIVGDRNNLALAITSPDTQGALRDIQVSGDDNAILSVLHGVSVVGDSNVLGEKDNPFAIHGDNWASYFDFNSNVNIVGNSNALNALFTDVSILGSKNELSDVNNLSVVGDSNKVDKSGNSRIVGDKNSIGTYSSGVSVVGSENKVAESFSAPSKNTSILGNQNVIQAGVSGISSTSSNNGGSIVGNRNRVEIENVNVLGTDNTVSASKPGSYSGSSIVLYSSSGSVIGDSNEVNNEASSVTNTNMAYPVTNKVMGNSNIVSGSANHLIGSGNTLGTKLASKVSENQRNKTSYNENTTVDIPNASVQDSVYQNNVVGSINKIFSSFNDVFGSQNTIASPISKAGSDNTVIGSYNTAYSNNSVLLGKHNELGKQEGNISGADASVLLGIGNKLWGATNNVLGINQTVLGEKNIAIGSSNVVGAIYSDRPALGLADVLPTDSIVIGREINSKASNSVAIGSYIETKYNNNVILGSFSEDAKAEPVTATDGVVFAGSKPFGVVSVGAKDKERQIVNVAAGRISAESTDAVNGSQIFALASYFEQALEGGGSGGNSQYIGINGEGWESNQHGEGAMGVRSIAIGAGAEATGYQASSIGQSNTVSGTNAYVYGGYNNVGAHDSTVLGVQNTTGSSPEIASRNSEIVPVGLRGMVANNNILGNYNNTDGSNIIVIGNNNSSGNAAPPILGRMALVANDEAGNEFPEPLPPYLMGNDFNTIIGDENNVTGFSNRVMGAQNKLYAQQSSVEGDNNVVGDLDNSDPMFFASNVKVNGRSNNVIAINTMVDGDGNSIDHTVNSIVNGNHNLLLNTDDYLATLANIAQNDDGDLLSINGSMALGNQNVIVNSNETVAIGHENSLVGENLYVMGSRNRQAFRTQSQNLFSPVPNASLSINSNIVGSENLLSNLILSNVVGYGNKIDAENTSVVGNSNTSNMVNHTVILGNQNHQATGSSLTASVGDNNMSNGSQIGIMGYRNTVGFDNTMDFKVADLTGSGIDIYGGVDIYDGIDIYGNPIAVENPMFPNVQQLPSMKIYETFVTGSENTVLSDQSVVMGTKNVLMPKNEYTASKSNIVIGGENKLKGDTNVVIGQNSGVLGDQLIAIGKGNVVTGNNSGAFGDPNTVEGTGSYAFGNDNTITADNTFVLGNNVNTTQGNSIVLGNNSTDSAAVAVAGANIRGTDYTFAGTSPTGVVSVGSVGGERQIQNVAAGQLSSTSTDAVNGSQLFATNQAIENLIATGAEPLAVKYDSTAKDKVTLAGTNGTALTNVKAGTIATGSTDAVNGGQIATIANNSTAVMGGNAVTNVDGTMTVSNIGGTGENTIDGAVGVAYNTAKKAKTTVTQGKNIVVTPSTNADGSSNYTVETADDLVATSITTDKSVTGSVVVDNSVVDANGNTLINGVGAGSIASGSTQAINGDQIFNLAKAASNNFGGGSVVNADGTISAPTYTVTNNSYNNVGDAITALDQADALNVKYDSATKDAITLAGASGTKLTNVKAGTIATGSTDAVNGGQIATIANNSTAVMGGNAVTNVDGTMTVSNIGGTGENTIDGAVGVAYNTAKKAKTTVTQGKNIVVTPSTNADGSSNYTVETADDLVATSITTDKSVTGSVVVDKSVVDANGNTLINGVGAGAIASGSTQAINGDQIFNLAKASSNNFGGGSVVNADGTISAPTYTVNNDSYNNVGDAITALDASRIHFFGVNSTSTYDSNYNGEGAIGYNAIAIGVSASSEGNKSIAMGDNAFARENGGIAIGADSVDKLADATSSTTYYIGANNKELVIGGYAGNNPLAVVSVGNDGIRGEVPELTRQIAHVAAGKVTATSTDAINGSQLYATAQSLADMIDGISNVDPLAVHYDTDSKDIVTMSGVDGTLITNVKNGTIATGSTDAVNGGQIATIANNSTAVMGGNAVTNVDGTMTVTNIGGTGENTIDGAVGVAYNTAKKAKTTVTQGKNIVVTPSVNADGSSNYTVATADDLVANSITTDKSVTGSVVIDKSVVDANGNTLINGVGAGAIASGSTQAINGDQIFNLAKASSNNFGGGSVVNANGTISAPTYTVTNNSYNNVGDAINALDQADALNVKYDSATKDAITLAGASGTKLTNVKAGTIATGSTDAVNGGQIATIANNSTAVMGGNAVTNVDGTMTVTNIGGTAQDTIDAAIAVAYKEGKAKSTASQGENIIVSQTANNDGSINYNIATARDVDFNSLTTKNAVMGKTVIINNIKVDRNGNSVISGVGAGLVAKNSTEAINGDQLYDAIKNTSNSLGGGSTVNANGNMTNPSYNINGGTYNNVGDALTALDNKIVNGTDPLAVKYDATDKSTITLAGENGTKITNVKDGVISATSTDAITGKQLNQTVQDTAAHLGGGSTVTVDGRVTAPSYTVDESSYNNVGDAISALDKKNAQQDKSIEQNTQAIVQTNNRITNEVSRIDQTNNRQDKLLETHTQEIEDLKNADKYNVKYNKDFSQVALIGKDGTGITNLKAGDISSTSTDAINGAQISKISQNSKDVMGGNAVTNVDGTMTVSNIGGTGQDTIDGAINAAYTAAQRAKSTVSAGKNIVVNKSLNSDGSTDYNVATADDVSLNSITTNNSKMGTVTVEQNVFDDRGNSIINGVGAGAIKQGSTQAINGDQLFNVSKSVASSLGGGAAVHSNGSVTNPTYTVSNANYNNVGDAIAAIDANDKNNVKYNADKSRVDLQGKDGTVIGNVKNGEVSETSKEAINGSQLKQATDYIAKTFGGGVSLNGEYVAPTFTVDQQNYSDVATAFSAIEQRSAQLEFNAYAYTNAKVNDLEQTLSAGIAATAALEQAPFVSGKWTYAVGSAYYNGQGAAGATIRKTSDNGRWSFTGGVAAGTQNTKPLVRMGVSGVF